MTGLSRSERPAFATPEARMKAVGVLAALSFFWGLNWPFMKMAVMEMTPWTFRAVCLVVAGAGMVALVWWNGERMRWPSRRDLRPLLLAAFVNITLWHVLTGYGLVYMEAGRAGLIAYLMPVVATVLATIVLGEPFTRRKALALVLGVAGLAVLVLPDIGRIGADLRGPAIMLCCAITWGTGAILIKRRSWDYSVVQLTTWQILLGGAPVVLIAVAVDPLPDFTAMSPRALFGLFYASTVALIFCHYTWYRILHLLPASVAAISTLAIPVVGIVSGAVLLGEPLGLAELAAMTLVVAAIAMVLLPSRQ